MLELLSFTSLLSVVAGIVLLILLVVRVFQKKPKKRLGIYFVVNLIVFVSLAIYIGANAPRRLESAPVTVTPAPAVEPAAPPVAPVAMEPEPASLSEAVQSDEVEPPAPVVAEVPLPAAPSDVSETPKPAPDYAVIRSSFDFILSESKGGILSIKPLSEDWRRVSVVVPDDWYRLEKFQKERYCERVGDLIKYAVVSANAAENMDFVHVYFQDAFGVEVATSGLFGYKVKK